jgi:hypothetical protein
MASSHAPSRVTATDWVIHTKVSFPPSPANLKRPGLVLFADRWRVEAERQGEPRVAVYLDVVVEDGRLCCERVELVRVQRAPGLSSANLRDIPVARLMRYSAFRLIMDVVSEDQGSVSIEPTARPLREAVAELRDVLGPRKPSGRPRGGSLSRIVALYQREIAHGNRAPRKVIAEETGYSVEYIGKRLSVARNRGLLGPARRGKAGEVSSIARPSRARRQSGSAVK